VKVNKNLAFGKLLEVKTASPNRTEPPCAIYKRCGGCQLQHLNYGAQLEFKEKRVKDCLSKIGKLTDVKVNPIIGMNQPFNYRNKVQLPVGTSQGKISIGFYAKRSHEIIDMESCLIQSEIADKIIGIVRNFVIENNIEAYDEETGAGFLRHIMVRNGVKTGEVMVVLVTTTADFPKARELALRLKENIVGLRSVIQNINPDKTNIILGEECKTLWGRETISDYIGDFKFNISPLSFFQVNPVQTEVLYKKALEFANLTGNETVIDAYCGTGTISLFLSQKAKKVIGVEVIPAAIENAKVNAIENGINNAEFLLGEAEMVIPAMIKKGIKAEVLVVDPPRKGCAEALLVAAAKMAPRTIVYVSCDPATLARDLRILEDLGYRTVEVQPVDMFPETAHVECCVRIERVIVAN
jgi:23S rRNA (uracil1939-C5)-methyltransferase